MARRHWSAFHNRGERLLPNPSGPGYDCDWRWTSDLTLARVFPAAGGRLLRAALDEWPIEMNGSTSAEANDTPEVSFVIGHRGEARLPLLLATISSLLSQEGCAVEVIVVEQARAPLLPALLPRGVRWIHQNPEDPALPFSRSWAFNRGAREARGRVLVCHDNDVLAPSAYASEILRLAGCGYEAMRLQRFVFYLDQAATGRVATSGSAGQGSLGTSEPEFVRQNCQGHTIAITRDAYFRIGGHDETFLDWGGEDNEFFDRCRLLRFHPWAYLPFVHLWHAPQPGKLEPARALTRLERAISIPREERAARLVEGGLGLTTGPLVEEAP